MRREKNATRLLALAIVMSSLPSFALAQQRGDFVEGVLRGLLESQIEKERHKTRERQQFDDRWRHGQEPRPPRDLAVPVEVQAYRTKLAAFAEQSASLTAALQQSAGRVRGIRPLMTDALKLKTRAALMYEKSQRIQDLALLAEEYCDLDCQWRELSFRLQQLRGLDATSLTFIRQLNGSCDDLCRLLELRPQFDREAVFRMAIETTTHLTTLLEDIQLELGGLNEAAALVRECRGLAEQCRRLGRLANDAAYDDLITRYSTFVSDWRRYAVKLYPYQNRYCDRGIRRIRSCNQQVFERLWTPLGIDRDYLRYVSQSLAEEVDALFDKMTVKSLVKIPPADQQAVLQLARDLYGQCEIYCECVRNNSPLNDLMTHYMQIDNQWRSLDRHLTVMTSLSVVSSRRLITAYGLELCDLLRVPAQLDRERAIQLAAALEASAEHLRYEMRRYARYYSSVAFRNQAYQRSDAFYVQAKNLHLHLQSGSSLTDVRSSCEGAVTAWEQFSATITAMPAQGLSHSRCQELDQSREEVLPVVAELAAALGA